jgi:hypothetical protein
MFLVSLFPLAKCSQSIFDRRNSKNEGDPSGLRMKLTSYAALLFSPLVSAAPPKSSAASILIYKKKLK